jgi:hypothetical protein
VKWKMLMLEPPGKLTNTFTHGDRLWQSAHHQHRIAKACKMCLLWEGLAWQRALRVLRKKEGAETLMAHMRRSRTDACPSLPENDPQPCTHWSGTPALQRVRSGENSGEGNIWIS